MDIQHLVDRLEDVIDEGRHIFGTKYTMIDEERVLEIIDQMRISIPEEIEKAQRVMSQRERILAETHEESARLLEQQRKKAEQLLEENDIVQAATARAERIKEQARQEASRITREADQYVMELLSQIEQLLVSDLNQVRNGISLLRQQMTQPAVYESAAQPVYVPNQYPSTAYDEAYETVDADYSAYEDKRG